MERINCLMHNLSVSMYYIYTDEAASLLLVTAAFLIMMMIIES
jgi:hypothetical protein